MRFGESYSTFKDKTSDGGGDYIRTFKEGDTVLSFLAEPAKWVGYLEHFNPNPGGYSFPCTQEDDCPGCNSDQDKMRGRSQKVAFPTLVDGKWVNVYKVTKKFAEKLAKRGERFGTMLDREYIITRIGTDKNTDYDVESGDRVAVDPARYEIPDIEQLLIDHFEQAWGTGKVEVVDEPAPKAPVRESSSSSPRTPDAEYAEEELRDMSPKELKKILRSEGLFQVAPDEIQDADDSDVIVDWMLKAATK